MAIYVPYVGGPLSAQVTLGHYATWQKSGATVNLGALGHIGRIRWAPTQTSYLCGLTKLKVGWSVLTAITAATPMDFDAIIHRGYSVDHTAAITNVNLSQPNTNKMRASMSPSQMGSSGPGICTTVVISGNTSVADANPFCGVVLGNQPSGNATVTQAIGVAVNMTDMFSWTGPGEHPPVLSNQEGIVVRHVAAGTASATMSLYLAWAWFEALVF